MRKKLSLQTILWGTMLVLFSCQKEAVTDKSNDLIISKVNNWLDKQKSERQPNKAANIDLLKENIDFSSLKFEDLNQNEQFIVIPIKENYKLKKNIERNTPAVLLLVRDKTGSIVRGNIVLYFPENNQQMNTIPGNTFNKMYSEKELDCDGLFRFLSPTGRWLYQREYKNGKLHSFGYVKADNTEARTSTECTYYFFILSLLVDGVIVAQETIYLGRICESGCDDPNNQTLCPDDGGGGGGGGGGEGQGLETCCIADPNVQFSHETTNISNDVCGLEGVNPITGNPTKTCTHTWTFDKWHLLWYNWDFTSFTKTDLEKEAGLWKFKAIAFQGVTRNGQLPPCASSECISIYPNPSISADQLKAKLILTYTIQNRISCYQWWSPSNVTSTLAKDWSPPS